MKLKYFLLILALPLVLIPTACNDEETDLGVNLQDPATYYQGTEAIIQGSDLIAKTVFDDSLLTSGYSAGIIGRYSDNIFGDVEASIYTQLSPASGTGINFSEGCVIDSVVLSLAVSGWYPDTNADATYQLHFEVCQLSEQLLNDTAYYAFSTLPVSSTKFYDNTITCHGNDTVIRLCLNSNIHGIMSRTQEQDEFIANIKGLRIRVVEGSDDAMATINFVSAYTNITTYYHYTSGDEATNLTYEYSMSGDNNHFIHCEHHYTQAPLNRFNNSANLHDSLSGNERLYLEPLAGTNIWLDLTPFVASFSEAHPTAVIHYAELLLPLNSDADNNPPQKVVAYKRANSGLYAYIPDLLDGALYNGFDGTYHSSDNCIHMRITRHLQGLLRTGKDNGTLLAIDNRRASARRTIINGTDASNPIRIKFIYSE